MKKIIIMTIVLGIIMTNTAYGCEYEDYNKDSQKILNLRVAEQHIETMNNRKILVRKLVKDEKFLCFKTGIKEVYIDYILLPWEA